MRLRQERNTSKFLSTLSLRRATQPAQLLHKPRMISIHALLAESDAFDLYAKRKADISIHALLAESDPVRLSVLNPAEAFLSTLSLRRATGRLAVKRYRLNISIHALLAESDCRFWCKQLPTCHFYPRSPCGERRNAVLRGSFSTLISIHALLAESDQDRFGVAPGERRFLSTLSLRRAT